MLVLERGWNICFVRKFSASTVYNALPRVEREQVYDMIKTSGFFGLQYIAWV